MSIAGQTRSNWPSLTKLAAMDPPPFFLNGL